jgi:hypothetical protein
VYYSERINKDPGQGWKTTTPQKIEDTRYCQVVNFMAAIYWTSVISAKSNPSLRFCDGEWHTFAFGEYSFLGMKTLIEKVFGRVW